LIKNYFDVKKSLITSTFLCFFLLAYNGYSQVIRPDSISKFKGTIVYTTIINGDTIPYVTLREFTVYAEMQFNSSFFADKYGRLKRDVKKAYPYAKIAGQKLKQYNDVIARLDNEAKKKKYLKLAEDEIKREFEGDLKKLTLRQGRILIKLIDRETGSSSYNLVKELRGSFSAFMWQSLARLFGSNLKEKYDPKGEDALIEEIVLKIENGEL
jgi:hypothetical protein